MGESLNPLVCGAVIRTIDTYRVFVEQVVLIPSFAGQ